MKTTKRGTWCLIAVLLAIGGKAWGDGKTQAQQSMDAKTLQQCREALPAYKAAYEDLVAGPAGTQQAL